MGLLSFFSSLLGLSGPAQAPIKLAKMSAAEGLPIIYGRRRVEPVEIFKTVSTHNAPPGSLSAYHHSVIPAAGGDEETRNDFDWLHRIDVWAQGEISDIERFWIDGDSHTAKRFSGKPYFRALSNYGTETQAAMTALSAASARWTAAHKGLGVAYSWTRFFNDDKKPQFTSEPRLKALVKGLRIYDPRIGSQSFSDSTTWAYSNNRALVVLNYLMAPYGFNAGEDEIDMDSFRAAADMCDELMDIPAPVTNTSGAPIPGWWHRRNGEYVTVGAGEVFPDYRPDQVGTTQPRWQADAAIDPKKGVIANLKTLLEGFGWAMSWSNGRHRLILEDAVPGPVMSFDEHNILGGWTAEHGSRQGRLNRITIEFDNANKDYERDTISWPGIGSAQHILFKDEDQGEDLHSNQSVTTITDFYAARAYGEFLVRKSRVNHRIRDMHLSAEAMLLEPGDVISLDYPDKGLTNDWFIVEKIDISARLEVKVDLIRYTPSVYGVEDLDQEPLNTTGDNPDLWAEPAAVTGLELIAVHEAKADGSVVSGLKVNWDKPQNTSGLDRYELAWKKSSDANYGGQRSLGRDSITTNIMGLTDNHAYDVKLSYWTQRGQQSAITVQSIDLPTASSKLDGIDEGATRNVYRGAWSSVETYVTGDVVSHDGNSYVFIADNTSAANVEPPDTEIWALLAARGEAVTVQYSAANPPSVPMVDAEWHTTFNPVADRYMRQRVGAGAWTAAILIVGEDGESGPYTDYRFAGASSEPAVTQNASNPGAIWYDAPPTSGQPVWMISAQKNADGSFKAGAQWSVPVRLTGGDGGYRDMLFRRAATQPATPVGSTPSGWFDGPPAANGQALWMTTAYKTALGALVGAWTQPQEIGGSGLEVQYSVNGNSGWHSTFGEGDLYMRQRLSGGAWSYAVRIVGEKGDPGLGADQIVAGKRWGFEGGSAQGWTGSGANITSGINKINFVGTSSNDPIFRSPSGLNIDGSNYYVVRVRFRPTGSDITCAPQIYYSTSGHGETEGYRKQLPTRTYSANEWYWLVFDMRELTVGGTDWTSSTINFFRFDLCNQAYRNWEIDDVTVGYFGSVDINNITAQDTSNVGGIPAITVRDRADIGYLLTQDGGTVLHHSSIPSSVANDAGLLRRSGGGLFTGNLNANLVTNTNELTDGAGLGSTAVWGNVTGSGRPADNATRNTGALADLNQVNTGHIVNGAVNTITSDANSFTGGVSLTTVVEKDIDSLTTYVAANGVSIQATINMQKSTSGTTDVSFRLIRGATVVAEHPLTIDSQPRPYTVTFYDNAAAHLNQNKSYKSQLSNFGGTAPLIVNSSNIVAWVPKV